MQIKDELMHPPKLTGYKGDYQISDGITTGYGNTIQAAQAAFNEELALRSGCYDSHFYTAAAALEYIYTHPKVSYEIANIARSTLNKLKES